MKEAVDLETGQRYAAKIIRKDRIKNQKDVDSVKREVQSQKMLDHPHVLKMFEALEDGEKLYLILELAPGGDLFDKIVAMGGFTEEVACHFFHQVMSGLEHCHSKGIIHRDLKPENLLLTHNEDIKISDFGLSNIVTDMNQLLKTHCGSEKYAAPEIMNSGDAYVGPPIDVWSAGCILFIMVGGQFPFVQATPDCDLYQSLVEGRFVWPKHFSPELIDLLSGMFKIDYKQRSTVKQVLEHPWFKLNNEAAAQDSSMDMALDDGATAILMEDEEVVYRSLAPDIMSCDAVGFDEEPVYRSVTADDESIGTPVSVGTPVAPAPKAAAVGGCRKGFACKATEEFSSEIPAEVLTEKLVQALKGNGVQVAIGADADGDEGDDNAIYATVKGPSGADVIITFIVEPVGSASQVAFRRYKGHGLDYFKALETIKPVLCKLLFD